MDDKRFERELKHKEVLQKQADQGASKESEQAPSATYDAFMRMQTGQETRTIADKINDPNRVSWEQFRKVREGGVGRLSRRKATADPPSWKGRHNMLIPRQPPLCVPKAKALQARRC